MPEDEARPALGGRRWPAPAKINLFLHVVGRRDDGYHQLQTLFQFLDLADEIRLWIRPAGIRRVNELPGVRAEDDLTVKAAGALQAAAGIPLGVDIEVTKRIPMGGGLGGGSSDAATVLVALNEMWGLGFRVDELAAIGLGIGADVPVFVRGVAAFAEGVGEKLTPVEVEEVPYLLVLPGCTVPTGAIFADPDLTRDTPQQTIRDLLGGGQSGTGAYDHSPISPFDLVRQTGNDCEAVVRARYPMVDAAWHWVSRYGPARMTGTGAAVFAPLADQADGEAALASVPPGWSAWVARGLSHSPLNSVLRDG